MSFPKVTAAITEKPGGIAKAKGSFSRNPEEDFYESMGYKGLIDSFEKLIDKDLCSEEFFESILVKGTVQDIQTRYFPALLKGINTIKGEADDKTTKHQIFAAGKLLAVFFKSVILSRVRQDEIFEKLDHWKGVWRSAATDLAVAHSENYDSYIEKVWLKMLSLLMANPKLDDLRDVKDKDSSQDSGKEPAGECADSTAQTVKTEYVYKKGRPADYVNQARSKGGADQLSAFENLAFINNQQIGKEPPPPPGRAEESLAEDEAIKKINQKRPCCTML